MCRASTQMRCESLHAVAHMRNMACTHMCRRFRLRNFDEIEVREYAPYIVAETTVEGSTMQKGLSQGFRRVAGYIFGNNTKQGSSDESQKVCR